MNIVDRTHWFRIKLLNNQRDVIFSLFWDGLPFFVRIKYDWYFRYRAALLQVQNPKLEVVVFWGNEPAVGKPLSDILRNKIIRKKGKITEYENKLRLAAKHWNSLFPIEEDDTYIKYCQKLERLKAELTEIQQELKNKL